MRDQSDTAISYTKLNEIFQANLTLTNSLESLGLLAEILSATTNDEGIASVILDKMRSALQERNEIESYFSSCDYARNLDRPDILRTFLDEGFKMVDAGGLNVMDYPSELKELLGFNPEHPQIMKNIRSNIDRMLSILSEENMIGEESIFVTCLSHIRFYNDRWGNLPYCAKAVKKLLEMTQSSSPERIEAEELFIDFLRSILINCDQHEIKSVYDSIKSVNIYFDTYDFEFNEILEEFRNIVEKRVPDNNRSKE